VRFDTAERLPLPDFPIPAYHLVRLDRYMLGSLQFSSGCPYRCEFCDIPALYGRQPRLKTPEQLAAELDAIVAQKGYPSFIYFVDDNFIGNRKATREMLPHLIEWQRPSAAFWLRGYAQYRQADRDSFAHAPGRIPDGICRYRNPRSRCAQTYAQRAECFAADA
jgi:hypothetical protein